MRKEPEKMSRNGPFDRERGHYRERACVKDHVGEQGGFGNSKSLRV